ncbi:hypothetical protein [Isoptericola aurantiacus]|uniref:hypothetical protein n=1 Tax=Isoptericola aurantiacus TaxID=3377839 RepID=UPI00383A1BFB
MADDARPAHRWDPGARYRPSRLAVAARSDPATSALTGRLRRGPADRTAVFDRPVWRPVGAAGTRTALGAVLGAYRRGVVDTSGLVRAVGRVLR